MKFGIMILAALGIAEVALAQFPVTNVPLHKPFIGMNYSPFLGNESPNDGTYPTVDQITYDITNGLAYLAGEISIYSMDGTQSNIPGICAQYNIKCYPCAFLITDDPAANSNQLNTLIAIANKNYPTTLGLIVGTEPITLYGYDPQTLISNINYVRAATQGRIPVGTREIPYYLETDRDIVAACDFVMADIHPYWGQVPINQAAAWTVEQWQELTNNFPGKKIIIGETGWPTGGTNPQWSNPSVIPSVSNQALFLSQFVPLANANNIEYFIFEYRDELWKVQEGFGTVEQNWGLFDTNTVKKQSLVQYEAANFFIGISSTNPISSSQITVNTYEGDPYSLYATGDLSVGWGIPAVNFFGAPGASQTTITVTNQDMPGPVFWRAKQDF